MSEFPYVNASSIAKEYVCQLCNQPWKTETAVCCPQCEEVYDQECLSDLALKEKSCKKCAQSLSDLKAFAPVHKTVKSLADSSVPVKCRFHLRQCAWVGKRSEFEAHIATCARKPPAFVYDAATPEELLCAVCHDVMSEARGLRTCDHMFCGTCIQRSITANPRCPVCTVACVLDDIAKVPKIIEAAIDNLKTKCAMHDGGCTWTGTRRDYIGHRATCKFLRGMIGGAATSVKLPEPALETTTNIPHVQHSSQTEQKIVGMLTIRAPELVKLEDRKDPLCISAVIDVSGSMQGPRLELAKQTLHFMINELADRDELGIVAFDTNVSVSLPVSTMTTTGKAQAHAAVDRLNAGSSTNLCGGLLGGVDQVLNRAAAPAPIAKSKISFSIPSLFGSSTPAATAVSTNKSRAILLLTDGEANVGPQTAGEIVPLLKKQLGNERAVVYTFGFGEGHNADLLRSIGDSTQGSYYYIQSTETMKEVFADCLGGLVSIVMKNIEVEVAAATVATIAKVMTKFPIKTLPSGNFVVSISDMYSEESRDILVEVIVKPNVKKDVAANILKWNLKYDNCISGKTNNTKEAFNVAGLLDAAYTGAPNVNVDEQMMRILVTEEIAKARVAAERHDFVEAKVIMTKAKGSLAGCVSKSTAHTKALMKDMDECDEMMNEDRYQNEGTKYMNQVSQAHCMQRCNRVDDDLYANNWKKEMRKK